MVTKTYPRPAKVSFAQHQGWMLLRFEQWQRSNYEIPPRDVAESDRRYRRWLLSFS